MLCQCSATVIMFLQQCVAINVFVTMVLYISFNHLRVTGYVLLAIGEIACNKSTVLLSYYGLFHTCVPALTESLWSTRECRQVLEALNHVLFQQLGYHGNNNDNLENSYIDQVFPPSFVSLFICCLIFIMCHCLSVV